MPDYVCPRCLYTTYQKCDFMKHLEKKKICSVVATGDDISIKDCIEIYKKKVNNYEVYKMELKIKELENENKNIQKESSENDIIQEQQREIEELKQKLTKYEKGGYIYIMHNPVFESFGNNVYKVGCSKNPELRLKDFVTAYPTLSKIVYKSKFFDNKLVSERELFKHIKEYRLENNREFFDIDIDLLIEKINSI